MVVEGKQHTSLGLGYLFGCLQECIWKRADVGLVGTAPPSSKECLIQVFQEASLCSSCGCSYSIAVATVGAWIKTGNSEETLGGLGDFTLCEKSTTTQSEERTMGRELPCYKESAHGFNMTGG